MVRVCTRRRRLAAPNDSDVRGISDSWYWSPELSSSFAASHSAAGLRGGRAVLGRELTAVSVVDSVLRKSCARVLRLKRLGLWVRSARPRARPTGAIPTVLRAHI